MNRHNGLYRSTVTACLIACVQPVRSPFPSSESLDVGLGGNVSAPGIFLDPCPTSGLLGGALRGRA